MIKLEKSLEKRLRAISKEVDKWPKWKRSLDPYAPPRLRSQNGK